MYSKISQTFYPFQGLTRMNYCSDWKSYFSCILEILQCLSHLVLIGPEMQQKTKQLRSTYLHISLEKVQLHAFVFLKTIYKILHALQTRMSLTTQFTFQEATTFHIVGKDVLPTAFYTILGEGCRGFALINEIPRSALKQIRICF